MTAIQRAQSIAAQEWLEFGDKNIDIQETSEGKVVLKVSLDSYQQMQKIYAHIQKAISADKLVSRGFVISLISQYDAFLGRLLHYILLCIKKTYS